WHLARTSAIQRAPCAVDRESSQGFEPGSAARADSTPTAGPRRSIRAASLSHCDNPSEALLAQRTQGPQQRPAPQPTAPSPMPFAPHPSPHLGDSLTTLSRKRGRRSERRGLEQKPVNVRGPDRTRKQVPLRVRAAPPHQQIGLLARLDPLG